MTWIKYHWRIWSHLLKKSLTENFIFCAVKIQRAGYYFQKCAEIFKMFFCRGYADKKASDLIVKKSSLR